MVHLEELQVRIYIVIVVLRELVPVSIECQFPLVDFKQIRLLVVFAVGLTTISLVAICRFHLGGINNHALLGIEWHFELRR